MRGERFKEPLIIVCQVAFKLYLCHMQYCKTYELNSFEPACENKMTMTPTTVFLADENIPFLTKNV